MKFTRSLLLLLGLLLAWAPSLRAHETLIGVLNVIETAPGSYDARWNFRSDVGMATPVARWPEHCSFEDPVLECGERGLTGTISVGDLGVRYSGVVIRLKTLGGPLRSFTLSGSQPNVTLSADGSVPWAAAAVAYIPIGVEHILLGVDHLMFVLGLMWLVATTRMLLATITAFTIAHSLTLAAATLGWLGVQERPVNAVIALSIVFVSVEVIKYRRGQASLTTRYPWLVAFAFGLLHGLGFAGALTTLGLTSEAVLPALLFFNVGVELGQIAFVFLVLALRRAHRALEATPRGVMAAIPVYLAGTLAMIWFIERLTMMVETG
jgi:hypothetical protein